MPFNPNDANGVPDIVESIAGDFEEAWPVYDTTLGYDAPIGPGQRITVSIDGSGGNVTFPGLPAVFTIPSIQVNFRDTRMHTYVAAHELFHAFQDGYNKDYPPGYFERAFWYEATAQWAAHEVNLQLGIADPTHDYAPPLTEYLESPFLPLETFAGQRQYGVFLFAEYLQTRFGTAAIKETWEHIRGDELVDEAIENVAIAHQTTLRDVLNDYAVAAYRLSTVDRFAVSDSFFDDPDADVGAGAPADAPWRKILAGDPQSPPFTAGDATNSLARPARTRVALVTGAAGYAVQSGFGDIGEGGMAFFDLVPPPATPGSMLVRVARGPSQRIDARVVAFSSYPDGICSSVAVEWQGDGTGTATVPWTGGCSFATLIVTHTDPIAGRTERFAYEVKFGTGAVTNGVVTLGINPTGNLDIPGDVPSSGEGTTDLGLRLNSTNAEALANGCFCEGWGVADTNTGLTGWANDDWGGSHNLRLIDYIQTGTDVAMHTDTAGALLVAHNYAPSSSPYLYQGVVFITNTGTADAHVRYRRVVDWDIEPTAYHEFITIGSTTGVLPPSVVFASNDGFASSDPLAGPSSIQNHVGVFTDVGQFDHGALFDLDLGDLSPGDTVQFTLFYGAAPDETTALGALDAVGAEVYSLAEPNTANGPTLGTPNTFIFAIGGLPYSPPMAPMFAAPQQRTGAVTDQPSDAVAESFNRNVAMARR